MVRIASGGEGVRRIGRDQVDLGHRQADFLRQALDDVVNARQIIAADRLGAISGERDLVGEKIGNEIHDGGEGERHQHPVLPAESAAGQHEQQRHAGEQECGFEYVAHDYCLGFLAQSIRCLVLGFGLWACAGHGQVPSCARLGRTNGPSLRDPTLAASVPGRAFGRGLLWLFRSPRA